MSKNLDIARSYPSAHISAPTAYHLLQGNLAVDNIVTTQGFNTTLYTGNGSTQSINTGIDMSTQWGNDSSEQFGGLVWVKNRSNTYGHYLYDTIRLATNRVRTDTTDASAVISNGLTSFSTNGFSIGNDVAHNVNTSTYASWNFQTTHRISGTTNHGKAYTCHYNPFTGFTIVKYEGSGIAGHEIPHHLGRKLGFVTTKNLTSATDWLSTYRENNYLSLNLTTAEASSTSFTTALTDNINTIGSGSSVNTSTNQYILYGWANSYIDESNKLIGNYEVGVYQGTGASGNKVVTRGKPAWVMIKRLDSTSDWFILDNKRSITDPRNEALYPNLSSAEDLDSVGRSAIFETNGFSLTHPTAGESNASGGQYLYMVAYDTNSNGGGSYYPRATDTSNLNISNAIIPFANGIDSNGTKITTLSKNESISGLTLTAGKNYVYSKNDGTYGVSKYAPCYGTLPTRTKAGETPDFFDVNSNKWFTTTGGSELVTNGTFDSNISWWNNVNSHFTYSNGMAFCPSATVYKEFATPSLPLVAGKKYTIIFSLSLLSGTMLLVKELTGVYGYTLSYYNTSGSYSHTFTHEDTATSIAFTTKDGTSTSFYIDNISIFEAEPTIGAEITTSRNYLNHIVYADNDGSPLYVEELPKVEYKDVIKANEYRGKNACTAWVNFDGTTTPPTIRDSYNVSSVVRTATGGFDVYFATTMDNVNFSSYGSCDDLEYSNDLDTIYRLCNENVALRTTSKIHMSSGFVNPDNKGNVNYYISNVFVMGGKNV